MSEKSSAFGNDAAQTESHQSLYAKLHELMNSSAHVVDLPPSEEVSNEPDPETKLDDVFRLAEIDDYKQNTSLRKEFSLWTFKLVAIWLIVLMFTVWMHGANNSAFHLTENEFIALITTSNVTIVGLFVIILKSLFSNKK